MTPTDESVWTAAVAGLLHDVGKFTLRAGRGGNRTWDDEAKADFKYKHAMLSASAVEHCVPRQWRSRVGAAVGNHHVPRADRVEELAVALADHLSAAERDSEQPDDEVDRKARIVHPQQLPSIFAQVKADDVVLDDAARGAAYWPLSSLSLDAESLFPRAPLRGQAVWDAYDKLYTEFESAADSLGNAHADSGDMAVYLESLQLLMQRSTWAIPAAYYKAVPDISLYDHSRTTAALAAVLVAQGNNAATLAQWHANPRAAPALALLVGADLSGVQDFLYTISSRGATSALRGRSFYLQILTEAIARYVLRRLGLPITNLLYVGGGNFYLLAAPRHQAQLDEIQREVSRILLQHHRGALYMALAATPLAGADFFDGKISHAWQHVGDRLQQVKLRRFCELDGHDRAWLFDPQGDGGNEEAECQVCGTEHRHTQATEGTRKCPACLSYEKLGKELRRSQYLLLQECTPVATELAAPPGNAAAVLAALGLIVRPIESLHSAQTDGAARATLLALTDAALDDLHPGPRLAIGRRLLANATPLLTREDADRLQHDPNYQGDEGEILRPDEIKPFSALAHDSSGIKRLGIVRMDVDNLGKLFAEGLGNQATLARVASLSFAVSLFFEGWADRIARQPDLRGHVYCIYSGGDDLFFVGAWDHVVEFTRRARRDFARYVAGHPGLHTSAGIALAASKYPLAQAADDAGAAEAKAKAYRNETRTKDAICFLDTVQPWERFGLEDAEPGITTTHALMRLLATLVTQEGKAAPRGLVRQLVRLALAYEKALDKRRKEGEDRTRDGAPQELWGPWIWQGVYQLSRMAARSDNPSTQDQIRRLRDHLSKGERRDMEWIGLAARWAELITR